jgi:hypothetical protein
MRPRAHAPPHPADPPTTTNRHTNASPPLQAHDRARGRQEKVVEARSYAALPKAVGAENVRLPLVHWPLGLHPSDEPLLYVKPL